MGYLAVTGLCLLTGIGLIVQVNPCAALLLGSLQFDAYRRPGASWPAFSYLAFLTVTLNDAFRVLALESVAEQLTTVRPIGNRLPDRGWQVTGTRSSTASVAVTL